MLACLAPSSSRCAASGTSHAHPHTPLAQWDPAGDVLAMLPRNSASIRLWQVGTKEAVTVDTGLKVAAHCFFFTHKCVHMRPRPISDRARVSVWCNGHQRVSCWP